MRLLPVGEDSLLIDLDTPQEAQAWHAEILRRHGEGTLAPVREIVPGEKTVLLYGTSDLPALHTALRRCSVSPWRRTAVPSWRSPCTTTEPISPRSPRCGVSEDDVARVHSGVEHRVAFSGFAPGFAYMTGLDERYHVPRRDEPRTTVPAGSVAVAGHYTGIYPRPSPGGWQLIGTTPVRLWDLDRRPATLLAPGTRVRFVPQGPADGNSAGCVGRTNAEGAVV